MTSAILARSRRDGFTLIEILTVVGILAVLIGILIPVIGSARRAARRSAIQADLQTIAMALEAFKNDHDDYPRPEPGQTGAAALCQALIGPGDGDGAPGMGIRKASAQGQGRIYGPYLRPETFPMANPMDNDPDFATHVAADPALLTLMPRGDNTMRPDPSGPYWSPILYYPARPGKRDIRQANAYIGTAGTATTAMFNFDINKELFEREGDGAGVAIGRMLFVMGDTNGTPDGDLLDAGETARFEGPFILWHPGFDAQYGPDATNQDALNKMDDITNFYP